MTGTPQEPDSQAAADSNAAVSRLVPRRSYADDDLRAAVASCHSWRGVLRHLGLRATSAAAARSVRRRVEELALDTSHFTGQRRWTHAQLTEAIASSRSWSQVAATLGLAGGSSTSALKGHAARLGIDSSHFARLPRQPPSVLAPMTPTLANLPAAGSLTAAAWFALCGYRVSWPLEPCRYDLVVSRDGELLRVQVKTTRLRRSGSWVVGLSTTSGGRHTYDPDDIDYFFVVDGDLEYYLIPLPSVGGMHALSLSSYAEFKLSKAMTT